MGSFSWLRADKTTRRSNLTMGDSYKILVPEVYGGGYIKDVYSDYGDVNTNQKAYYVDKNKQRYALNEIGADLYGILAYWNKPELMESLEHTHAVDMMNILLNGDTSNQTIRCQGIDIGCYNNQIDDLEYPLKLVSASCKLTYEECWMRSYNDPNQGFGKTYWQ